MSPDNRPELPPFPPGLWALVEGRGSLAPLYKYAHEVQETTWKACERVMRFANVPKHWVRGQSLIISLAPEAPAGYVLSVERTNGFVQFATKEDTMEFLAWWFEGRPGMVKR